MHPIQGALTTYIKTHKESYGNYKQELACLWDAWPKLSRRGSITELCSHSNIQALLDACGRSGHATGTSLDSYLDKSFIVRGLVAARLLQTLQTS
jgi:hypothetical protein